MSEKSKQRIIQLIDELSEDEEMSFVTCETPMTLLSGPLREMRRIKPTLLSPITEISLSLEDSTICTPTSTRAPVTWEGESLGPT